MMKNLIKIKNLFLKNKSYFIQKKLFMQFNQMVLYGMKWDLELISKEFMKKQIVLE
jgi:hypothetical protein